MTKPLDDLDRHLDEAFGGTQEQLDATCRTLPRRSWSLAELREQDLATFFADRPVEIRDVLGGSA